MKILYFILFYISIINANFFENSKSSMIKRDRQRINDVNVWKAERLYNVKRNEDMEDAKAARKKAEVLKRVKTYEKKLNMAKELSREVKDPDLEKQRYHKDPILNYVKNGFDTRKALYRSPESTESSSSSLEVPNWKDEFKEHWLQKKLEAINSSVPKGDKVNMLAARPWGVPCGDPNQHDLPWGNCMLPMECEAEFRIYRGDYLCGRTNFICCALQVTNYDLDAGFDISFDDSSLATDSEEKRNRDKGSKERRRKKRIQQRRRRIKERLRRKRKIKKTIRKIMREMRKILNRSFRNGTTARKKKTRQLKKFIKQMKKRYLKERNTVKDIHEMELIKIDAALQKKLNEIRGMNQEYLKNQTFRDIIVNGTISKKNARLLLKSYPELMDKDLFDFRRRGHGKKPKDYSEYDVEYGYLYY